MDGVQLAPIARIALLGALLALGPLAWWWLRHRGRAPAARLHALTLLTLFLTFDLVLFGAFTRLTDSGLGCPDWPGCYGEASPVGAREHIAAAEAAQPTGPVTHAKAWIEMLHRYLASGVGVLIAAMALVAWLAARRDRAAAPSPWWALATLVWVCVQGAFGALTVTMKLYPAVVTAHLLGGMALLVLLAAQAEALVPRPLALPRALVGGAHVVAALVVLQVALGAWVSTNYAVLACTDFPTCQGSWWPPMDFEHGYTLQRELGQTGAGAFLPFEALTAIHYTHRLAAYVVLGAIGLLAWRLHGVGERRFALGLAGVGLWQLGTGLSNVVLGWPLAAAVAHTGGAAAGVVLLTVLLARARATAPQPAPAVRMEPAS
jgi:cytochrome c oxidase assembly protein subunit 15